MNSQLSTQGKPPTPQPGKWTKLFPTLMFKAATALTGSVFKGSFMVAYDNMTTPHANGKVNDASVGDQDHDLYDTSLVF